LAENSRPSEKLTVSLAAFSTTWLLVRMYPLESSTTPEPVPLRPGWGAGRSNCSPKKRSNRRSSSGGTCCWRRSLRATRGCSDSTSMRTTLGARALATVEKDRESARASFGVCVFGVTGAGADSARETIHPPTPLAAPSARAVVTREIPRVRPTFIVRLRPES
jgi:hypothetical protein